MGFHLPPMTMAMSSTAVQASVAKAPVPNPTSFRGSLVHRDHASVPDGHLPASERGVVAATSRGRYRRRRPTLDACVAAGLCCDSSE